MLTAYKSGAEQEAEIVTRYENGAEVEAEAVYAYKSGAEEEVWSAMEIMSVISYTIPCGQIYISDSKLECLFHRFEDKSQSYGSLSGESTIRFKLDVPCSAPTIIIDWEGGMIRRGNATSSNYYRESAGSIRVYAYKADGTYDYDAVSVGSTATLTGYDFNYGTKTMNFTGEYTHIEISIQLKSYAQQYYEADQSIWIRKLTLDGEEVGFTPEAEQYSVWKDDY